MTATQYSAGSAGLGITSQAITSTIGAGLMTAGKITASVPGGQIAGAVLASAGALTALIGSMFKPDLTKIEATKIVNQIEAEYLKPNLATWQSLRPEEKTRSVQAAMLHIFDMAWDAVRQGCGNPQLGAAGANCISERARGACHWTLDGQTPGAPPNNCGNWFTWFRDPIANDPNVLPDPAPPADAIGSAVTGFFGSGGGEPGAGPSPALLLVAAALVLWAVLD